MDWNTKVSIRKQVAAVAGVSWVNVEFIRGRGQDGDQIPQFIDVHVKPGQAPEIAQQLQAHGWVPCSYTDRPQSESVSLQTYDVAPELFREGA